MTILAGYGEDYAYFVPDIGDTIYDLVWHRNHYEYVKRIVDTIYIDKDGVIVCFEKMSVGRRLQTLGKLWFLTEKEAIAACKKYKNLVNTKGGCET